MPLRDSITLLHVSDPQFGKNHRFATSELFQRLSDDLKVLEDEGVRPQVLVASGDLAEWGMKSEFRDALAFLVMLTERLGIERRHVVIVPGNHDINRSLCEGYFSQCKGEEVEPRSPFWPKWKHYAWMFEEFYKGEKGISFTVDEPWSWWEIPELELVVAGLNSTMAESHLDGTHYGSVGEPQLRWFRDRLEPYLKRGWFRLGVVHHNALRGAVDDDENLRDADDLTRVLRPSLNLLLHGHTHNSKIGWLDRDFPVLSTGSAALKVEARPPEVPNQYQAIRLSPRRIERWTRRYELEQKRWIGDTRCDEHGKDWRIQHSVKFVVGAKAPAREKREAPVLPDRYDFLSRVGEVCKLRFRGAEVDIRLPDYVKVRAVDGPLARVFPVGVCENNISEERLGYFQREVFALYRAYDPNLLCELVYGGDPAPEELVRKASADGVRLCSFVEFQGIIDFRNYVARQSRRLESDVVYPPQLYVSQHLIYEVGRDERQSRDACGTILEWLREPLARFALVLGDFGAGKTFLLHELARRMPMEIPRLTPVLIELRALEKAPVLEQLIAQHLAAKEERLIDLDAFPYMLRKGRIALLFDGFDELAQRVTYARATEHFETLLQAAAGRAKVVVTSRTQHFESDRQVKNAIFERTTALPGLHVARLQPFDEEQIIGFLEKLLGDREAAAQRFELIRDIRDLLGLSHNPRMLGFIASLPEEQLREAQAKTGRITSAELYRLLLERWLVHEYERHQPRGSAPSLTVQERWDAVTAVALRLWGKLERTIALSELNEEVGRALDKLTEKHLDVETATHLVGSGTLLVRDEEGLFAFAHLSVLEWLVANRVAEQLKGGAEPQPLAVREISPLMADFLRDMAGREITIRWAMAAVRDAGESGSAAKANALLLLERLGWDVDVMVPTVLAELDLRGKSFGGHSLVGADVARADLTEAQLEGTDLTGADLSGAILERANLTRAKLVGAKMDGVSGRGARLLGADLRGASLTGASLRRAKLVGAQFSTAALAACDTFGCAPPDGRDWEPAISAASSGNSVVFGPDGMIASGHSDGAIRLWDSATGQQMRSFRGHTGSVGSVAFSPDGLLLASASEDQTVRLWEVSSGRLLRFTGHESAVRSVAFSPDGLLLASASDDKTMRLWEASSGCLLRSFEGHQGSVYSVAFSREGLLLASASYDKTVRLWEVASGRLLYSFEGHQISVSVVAFSPDGRLLASASYDNTVRLWEASSGRLLHSFEGHQSHVFSVAFSPDGFLLASAGYEKTVLLWDVSSAQTVGAFVGHESYVRSIAFSPDGLFLASGGDDRTVRLWDASSQRLLRSFSGRESWVASVVFSPDGLLLASASYDNIVRLWDAHSGRLLRSFSGHEGWVVSIAFSPDGLLLASASFDKTLRLWETSSGRLLRSFEGHEGYVSEVAFSPHGLQLASASFDRTVRLWETSSGRCLRSFGHKDSVRSVDFSPDGLLVVSVGDDDTVRLWDASSGLLVQSLSGHTNHIFSVAFSPDGLHVASGSCDKTVRLWEVSSGKLLRSFTGHEHSVNGVAFSRDGLRIASASADQSVRIWEVSSGQLLRSFHGHEGILYSVAFSPDGLLLASSGQDNTIRLWDVETGALHATLLATAEGWAAFTPDGRYKVSGNLGGAFWYVCGLCRFEPGELDPFLPPGTLREMAADEAL